MTTTFEAVKLKKFLDYKVSTKTFIANTNLILNTSEVFKVLPITDWVIVQKKRGRKKKQQEENPNKDITTGSIISVQNSGNVRGVSLKEGKQFFRNSMEVVMFVDTKMINFKVSRNGKFQITGCKEDEQAEKCVSFFWSYIRDHPDCYSVDNNSGNLVIYYEPAMYNIDFSLGFSVNRENLDNYINTSTKYNSLLETTFGYTGVNIKMPVIATQDKLLIKRVENNDTTYVTYNDFMNKFKTAKQKAKQLNRLNTFLVFQSGKVIMSGQDAVFMQDTYAAFINIISECYDFITEKLT